MIRRLANPKICRVCQQTGDLGELMVWFQSEGCQAETKAEQLFQFESEGRKKGHSTSQKLSGRKNSFLLRGDQSFCFI